MVEQGRGFGRLSWVIEKIMVKDTLVCAFCVISDTISRCVESFGTDGVRVPFEEFLRNAEVLNMGDILLIVFEMSSRYIENQRARNAALRPCDARFEVSFMGQK